jgi:hypothetical protein
MLVRWCGADPPHQADAITSERTTLEYQTEPQTDHYERLGLPQSQAAPSASQPGTIDIIRQPSLLRQKLAGNCTTTCQWIGRQQFCNTHCF